ncbi:MAG: hypothetical protein MZW92_57495 [Comamonadaceae bacterium]|nr:hypothetical protein [Comamonadaceae bacterium]
MAERGIRARRGDADAGPLRAATMRRRRRAWSSSTAARARRCSWPPAAARSRATRSSATSAAARAWSVHTAECRDRQAPVRARQRALDAGGVGRGADARLRDQRHGAGAATARACWRRWPRRSARPRPTSPTWTWTTSARPRRAELRLLVSVRDRLHLADVLRTLRRVPVHGAARAARAATPRRARSERLSVAARDSAPRAPRCALDAARRHAAAPRRPRAP